MQSCLTNVQILKKAWTSTLSDNETNQSQFKPKDSIYFYFISLRQQPTAKLFTLRKKIFLISTLSTIDTFLAQFKAF